MRTDTLRITNKLGLHARAAAKWVRVTGAHVASVKVTCAGRTVDGKSIMAVMLLAAGPGTELTVQVDGEDEAALLASLRELVDGRFGEDE
jgi:phosphocarrier protein